MSVPFTGGRIQIITAAGVQAGALIYTYAAGTTTPLATFTNQDLANPSHLHANPIVCDTNGQAVIWPTPGVAYRYVVKTAAGALITDDDNLDGSVTDANVTISRDEANSVDKTLHFYIQHSKLEMSNYCDPTSDTPAQIATAIGNAITDAKAGGKALVFEAGATYTTNAEAAFLGSAGLKGLRYWGNGCTIFRNAGVGPVASLNPGGVTSRCDEVEFLDFVLKGQALSTYGLMMSGVCRSKVRARAVDVATAGFQVLWGVTTDYDLTVSSNIDTFTVNPATGVSIDQSSAGLYAANCNFRVVMEAPITTWGVDLLGGGLGNIFRGTCEGITGGGFRQQPSGGDCVLIGMDFESNGATDVRVNGRGLTLIDGECHSAATNANVEIQAGATQVRVIGGYRRWIDIATGATGISLVGTSLSDDVSLGITGTASSSWRGTGNVKVNTSRVITSNIADQGGDVGAFTATLTGCTTSPTSSCAYRRFGDLVTLDIPAITATSNTTAATITGMPAAIRPASTKSAVGIVTENSANALGRYEVDSSGVITLRNGAASVFTNSGTKGSQACTIVYKV